MSGHFSWLASSCIVVRVHSFHSSSLTTLVISSSGPTSLNLFGRSLSSVNCFSHCTKLLILCCIEGNVRIKRLQLSYQVQVSAFSSFLYYSQGDVCHLWVKDTQRRIQNEVEIEGLLEGWNRNLNGLCCYLFDDRTENMSLARSSNSTCVPLFHFCWPDELFIL